MDNPKMAGDKDKNGRRFWFDPKWNDIIMLDHITLNPLLVNKLTF